MSWCLPYTHKERTKSIFKGREMYHLKEWQHLKAFVSVKDILFLCVILITLCEKYLSLCRRKKLSHIPKRAFTRSLNHSDWPQTYKSDGGLSRWLSPDLTSARAYRLNNLDGHHSDRREWVITKLTSDFARMSELLLLLSQTQGQAKLRSRNLIQVSHKLKWTSKPTQTLYIMTKQPPAGLLLGFQCFLL